MNRMTLLASCAVLACTSAWAKPIPSAPQLAAKSYIMMDADSGQVIVAHNESKELPPASLTKLMTSYVVERELQTKNIHWDDMVPISVTAWRTGGSKMFIKEGTQVSVGDLLKGVVIQSGNDASVALSEYIAGSEDGFVDVMNQYAEQLGMKNTEFANSTGLPSDRPHYSSAKDMAILARAIIKENADYYYLYAEKEFTYNDIRQTNRNKLLWRNPDVDGLKTGHTTEAGYCLVTSAKDDGMRLITAVFGTSSEEARAQETQKLLSYGFRYFKTHEMYKPGQVINEARVWYGAEKTVNAGVQDSVFITIPKGQQDNLQGKVILNKDIEAPISVGQQLGTMQITLDDRVVLERPIVALNAVEEGGFFSKIWDAIVQFFIGLFK